MAYHLKLDMNTQSNKKRRQELPSFFMQTKYSSIVPLSCLLLLIVEWHQVYLVQRDHFQR